MEAREMLELLNPQLDSAIELIKLLKDNDEVWREYIYRDRLEHDRATLLFESERRGEERGIRMGEERGRFLKTVEVAKRMLACGRYSIEYIVEITGLTRDDLESLVNK